MTGVVTNGGKGIIGDYSVNKQATSQNLILKLFKNDFTPVLGSVVGDLTEATFTGYSAITLTGASWTNTPGDPVTMSYAEQTFTSSADQTAQSIYGYYLVRATGGELIIAERFTGGAVTIQNNGDAIRITPSFTVDS